MANINAVRKKEREGRLLLKETYNLHHLTLLHPTFEYLLFLLFKKI